MDYTTDDSCSDIIQLTLKNIIKKASDLPGVVILYNKNKVITNYLIANEGIELCLLDELENNTSDYFSFREIKIYQNPNSVVYI